MQSHVQSQQKTVNKLFKDWLVLAGVHRPGMHRHDIALPRDVARSIVIITQVKTDNGKKLF